MLREASVRKSLFVRAGALASPWSSRPPPPRNPRPLTETVAPPSAIVPLTSMASTPPVAPFHAGAVSVEPSVAIVNIKPAAN